MSSDHSKGLVGRRESRFKSSDTFSQRINFRWLDGGRSQRLFLLLAFVFACLVGDTQAQLYWNTNGVSATWTAANWNTTGTGSTYNTAWAANSNVIFGVATGGTNNVTFATATVGDITVNGNTTISAAGTVSSKSGGSTVTVADGVTLNWLGQTYSATGGSFNWVKNGNGIWDQGSGSTISATGTGGGITLNAGTLISRANNGFGGANGRLTINGGIFAYGNSRTWGQSNIFNGSFGLSNATAHTASFTGNVNVAANITITNMLSNAVTFSGAITNTGGLVFTNTAIGTSYIILSGANTFSGGLTLNSGQIRLDSTTALGTGTFTINGGTFDSGSGGAITNANNNAMVWGGNFTYAGTTNYGLGTGSVNLSGNRTVTVTANQLTVGGAVTNTGQLTKAGAGTLLLDAAGTYSGGTVINAGILAIGSSTALGSGGITINGGALAAAGTSRTVTNAITVGGNFQLGGASMSITLKDVDLGGATRTITFANSATINGAMSNGNAVLDTSNSARTFTVASSGSFTGSSLTLRGGSLIMNGTVGANTAVDITATSTAATNDISGHAASSVSYGSLAGATNSTVLLGAKNLSVGGNNSSTTFAGAASGAGGGITKVGTGTMTFSGTSTYTGATTVDGGKFVMNGTNTSSAVTVSSGGTVGGSGQLGAITLNGTVAPGNSIGTLKVGNTTFGANGAYELEMYNWAGTAGSGWDLLDIGGTVTFGNTSANPFSINLFSMSSTTERGLSTGWNPDVNWTNNFATYTSVAGGSSFDASAFVVNTNNFSNILNGSFSVVQNGNALALLYTTAFVPSGSFDWNVGSGAWNSAMNWTNGAVPTNGNSVVFTGAGGNSTNNAVTSIKGMVFSNTASGSYVVSGNALTNGVDGIVNNSGNAQTVNNDITLGIGQTFNAASNNLTIGGAVDTAGMALTVAGASNTVINGAVTGAGGSVTKIDAGTLTLNGTNTYTGGTTVTAGKVVGNSDSLQGGILNNASVEFSQNTSGTYGGVMSGTGRLEKSGAGSLTLTGTNTYSGGTLVSGGSLVGDATTMRGNITNNATVVYNQTVDGTNTSLLTGSGDVVKQGAGILTLNNNGNSQDNLDITAGGVRARSTNAFNTINVQGGASLTYGGAVSNVFGNAVITLQNGAILAQDAGMGTTTADRIITNNLILAGNVQLGGSGYANYLGGNIDLGGAARTITFSNSTDVGGVISNGSGLTLDSGGSTTRTFSLTNGVATYSGATTVNGGVLALVNSGGLAANSAVNLAATTTNATLNISGISAVGTAIGSLAGATNSTVSLGSKNLSVGANDSSTTFEGVLSGSGGSLTKTGSGTLTLSGTNTYTGGSTVNSGKLAGTTASLQGAIVNNANVEFSQSAAGTYAGAMSGSGALTKSGSGDVTLSGANSYSGGTTVSAGKLIGSTTSLQGAIANAGTVEFSQSTSGTYAGAVSGAGSVVKSGSGNVTLSGANSYSGGTTVNAGILTGDATSLQGAIANNATVAFNQSADGTYAGTLSGAGALTKSGSGNLTLSGNNSGYSGAVTVGAGKVSVAANSALGTGAVTITNGSVMAGNGRSIANNFVLGNAASSGVYYSQDFNSIGSGLPTGWSLRTGASSSALGTAASLTTAASSWGSGAGQFANFAATTGLTSGASSATQAASADRALGVQQTGSFGDPGASFIYSFNTLGKNVTSIGFDLMLLANNPRSTTWTIEYGLGATPASFSQLGTWSDPGAWGATSLNFTSANFGTSLNNQSDVIFRISALAGSTSTGIRDPMAIDNFVINTATAASGSGALGIEEVGITTYTGNITVNNGGTLSAVSGGQANFSGVLSGAGGITKTGEGKVVLAGANTLSGASAVNQGTLEIASGGSITSSALSVNNGAVLDVEGTAGAVTVNNGGRLEGSGSVGALTVASGGTLAVGNSPGTMTASSATWEGGGIYSWEFDSIAGNSGSSLAGQGINWDFLNVSGVLDITAASGSPFIIDIVSLLAAGDTSFDQDASYSFAIATAAGGITNFLTSDFSITGYLSGSNKWSLGLVNNTGSSQSLVLSYNAATAIPEPSTGGLLLIGLGLVAAFRRKRKV